MRFYLVEQDGEQDNRLPTGRGAVATIAEARRVARELGGRGQILRVEATGKAELVDLINFAAGAGTRSSVNAEVAEEWPRRREGANAHASRLHRLHRELVPDLPDWDDDDDEDDDDWD